MTISAVADSGGTPPSVDVTVSSGTGTVMSSVSVWRNDSAGRSLLRVQPSAGFDERTVTDYECPFGQSVTYDWEASYTDPSGYVTLFDETWASTAAWTVLAGGWAVSGGMVHNTANPSELSRTFANDKYRVTLSGLDCPAGNAQVYLYGGGSGVILSINSGVLSVAGVATTIDPTATIVVDFLSASVVVTGTGGSKSLPGSRTLDYIGLRADTAASGFEVDNIKVQSYGVESEIAETSDPVTLNPADAWLIHPATPGLSIPLAHSDGNLAGIRSIAPVTNATNATVHKILGSATPITTTTGPRTNDQTAMDITTVTTAEAAALRALLAPDIPILIQIPPDWDLDFNCGFYQVGDTSAVRMIDTPTPYRITNLPLTKVRSPIVDVANTGWSYADVAVEFATYSALPVTFVTYADLATESRS